MSNDRIPQRHPSARQAQLRAWRAHDAALEQWLLAEGVACYDAYHRDPTGSQPAAEVFAQLRKRAGETRQPQVAASLQHH